MPADDADRRLGAALAPFPLRPLPAGFVERTMARALAARRPLPAHDRPPRLTFLDLVLPAFAAAFALAVGLVGWGMAGAAPQFVLPVAELSLHARWLATVGRWEMAAAGWPAAVGVSGLGLWAAALLLAWAARKPWSRRTPRGKGASAALDAAAGSGMLFLTPRDG